MLKRLFGRRGQEEKAIGRPLPSRGGWLPIIRDHYPGAWQRNDEIDAETALTHHAVFACMTLIARDIAKLRLRLLEKDENGVSTESASPAFSQLLRQQSNLKKCIQNNEHRKIYRL